MPTMTESSGANARLERMMEQYGNDLLRICCVYLKDASMAEDAVQETFVKAYRHMDTFRGASSEKTWLVAIAINVCRDMRRSAWFRYIDRTVDFEKLRLPVTPEDERTMLMQEIMRLPRRSMETVLLHYYADLTLEEIAQMLQISQPAVSKRLSKARRMLKDALEGGKRL